MWERICHAELSGGVEHPADLQLSQRSALSADSTVFPQNREMFANLYRRPVCDTRSMRANTRRKLPEFEKDVAAVCATCRKVALEFVEIALLLAGLYEVLTFHLFR